MKHTNKLKSLEKTEVTLTYGEIDAIIGKAIKLYDTCGSEGMIPGGPQYRLDVMSMFPGYVDALGNDMSRTFMNGDESDD